LGNTRLAILDPGLEGNQPLLSEDGTIVAVFNGEIYNYRELVRTHGLKPGRGDGGVIPQLYQRFGTDFFGLLRGMFAIILVDLQREEFILARDSLGIKPLHWRRLEDGTIVVASEVRPLLRHDDRHHPTDSMVARFLHLGAIPGDMSPFEDVVAVGAGTYLVFGADGKGKTSHYTSPEVASGQGTSVRDAVLGSVDLHLRSDVPTTLLLSSGIDSSAVAWAARMRGVTLHAVTVDLGGGRSEAVVAEKTASHYGHNHQVVRREPTSQDVADIWTRCRDQRSTG
jgi:asparagine synthase (glutamine-hydrolysing)